MNHFRQILLALLCMFLTVSVLATSVPKENAAKVAKNFFSEIMIPNRTNETSVISESFDITKDGNTALYVFNFENGGYVIVSAEDRFTPILGYSPNGRYLKDNMAEGFEFLLGEFSDMIIFIRDHDLAPEPQYTEKWERYESNIPDRGITIFPVVGPLTALWNQDSPYNFYCPTVKKGGSGGKAYAGCVATAMSMIMYYWRWPWQGTGELSYVPTGCPGESFGVQKADFGNTIYDYNGMYGTPALNADKVLYEPIALLQYHTGISVRMMYCGDGSGSFSPYVPPAMKNYFKYDPSIQHVQRQTYINTAAWNNLFKGQLDLKQPIYVSGRDKNNEGHAFVCDGYDSNDMFHYNFGWSGYSNGYFVSDKPGDFTFDVAAIINFIPNRAMGYPINSNGSWTVSHMRGMIADGSGPVDNYTKGATAMWLIDPGANLNVVSEITINSIEMDLASGDFLRIYDGANDNAPLLGEFSGSELFDAVTSTGSKMFVKFTSATTSPTAKGFMISYLAKSPELCDSRNPVTFTAASGTFTDGSPENMNYNSNTGPCTWNIWPEKAGPDSEIHLKFNRLETEEGADVVRVYENTKLIATLSGKYEPADLPEFFIKAARARVIFVSNSYVNDKGFEITYSTTLGIEKVENINNLSVYPNPVKDRLNIAFNTSTPDDYSITIYSVTGQAIYNESLPNFIGEYSNKLNISNFAQGVYLLQIKSSKGIITRKIVF